MADKNPLTPEEVTELFSEIDASGVLDPTLAKKRTERMREKEAAVKRGDKATLARLRSEDRASQAKHIDPLSEDDPSGSQVSHTITKTAMAVVIGILVLIVGMQIGYGVMRRLNTANLSESVSVDTVSTALKGGLEWGNGFTQFPLDFTVDEADERTGTVEVTVLDTSSANELELLSNGQIQAAALATNALLNDKIDRVVYNVHAYIDEDSRIQHDSFFGMFPAQGHQSAILTFVWTKSSSNATSIDWKMRIVSMDDTIAERIQKQVNSVSSLIEDPVVSQTKITEEQASAILSIVCTVERSSAAESPIARRPSCWSRTSKSSPQPHRTMSSRVNRKPTRDDFFGTGIKKSLCTGSHNYHFVNNSM